jgi:hypothetical protein
MGKCVMDELPFADEDFLFTGESLTPLSRHHVLDVLQSPVLTKHAYWSVMSDLHNAFGHASMALRFLRSPPALALYMRMIARMQGEGGLRNGRPGSCRDEHELADREWGSRRV